MSKERVCRIATVPPSEATGSLKSVYQTISPDGNIAHILQAQSLDPEALSLHHTLYRRLMFGASGLSRTEREMIAVVVSRVNGCEY